MKAKTATMAAAPVRARLYVPKGKAATRSLPTGTFSMNRVHMDENAEVTFGVTTYPPWMQRALKVSRVMQAFRSECVREQSCATRAAQSTSSGSTTSCSPRGARARQSLRPSVSTQRRSPLRTCAACASFGRRAGSRMWREGS